MLFLWRQGPFFKKRLAHVTVRWNDLNYHYQYCHITISALSFKLFLLYNFSSWNVSWKRAKVPHWTREMRMWKCCHRLFHLPSHPLALPSLQRQRVTTVTLASTRINLLLRYVRDFALCLYFLVFFFLNFILI